MSSVIACNEAPVATPSLVIDGGQLKPLGPLQALPPSACLSVTYGVVFLHCRHVGSLYSEQRGKTGE